MKFIRMIYTDELYKPYRSTSYLQTNFIRINYTDKVNPYVKNLLADHHSIIKNNLQRNNKPKTFWTLRILDIKKICWVHLTTPQH